jgi:DNA-binding response OmpR family regulator
MMLARKAHNDDTLHEGLAAGCDDSVSKPLRCRELAARVKMQVNRMQEIKLAVAATGEQLEEQFAAATVEDITHSAEMHRRHLRRRPSDIVRKRTINPSEVTILSVDDNPINLTVVENTLVPEGFEVISCDDGFEALKTLMERKASAIIM